MNAHRLDDIRIHKELCHTIVASGSITIRALQMNGNVLAIRAVHAVGERLVFNHVQMPVV